MQRIGFWGRLSSPGPDDAPIAIWRVGKADLAGFKNNDLVDKVCDAFACHLEDLMQAGRAASLQHKKMVRARLVIDVGGVGEVGRGWMGQVEGWREGREERREKRSNERMLHNTITPPTLLVA